MFGLYEKVITLICQLYKQGSNTVVFQGTVGDWFCPTVRVHQDCLLSPTLFSIFLEWILGEVLDSASSMVSIGSRNISDLRYDDIDIMARSGTELAKFVQSLDSVSRKYCMEINAKKDESDDKQQKWLQK